MKFQQHNKPSSPKKDAKFLVKISKFLFFNNNYIKVLSGEFLQEK